MTFKALTLRSTIDEFIDDVFKTASANTYPFFNLIQKNENSFTYQIAVAGFSKDELSVNIENGYLIISGEKNNSDTTNYLYKGISSKSFTKAFKINPRFEVLGAFYENGLLCIDLKSIETIENKKEIKIK